MADLLCSKYVKVAQSMTKMPGPNCFSSHPQSLILEQFCHERWNLVLAETFVATLSGYDHHPASASSSKGADSVKLKPNQNNTTKISRI